jgi:hypothetical protein
LPDWKRTKSKKGEMEDGRKLNVKGEENRKNEK